MWLEKELRRDVYVVNRKETKRLMVLVSLFISP